VPRILPALRLSQQDSWRPRCAAISILDTCKRHCGELRRRDQRWSAQVAGALPEHYGRAKSRLSTVQRSVVLNLERAQHLTQHLNA
jgi:hypothetical protein